jgi:hypothetical protein
MVWWLLLVVAALLVWAVIQFSASSNAGLNVSPVLAGGCSQRQDYFIKRAFAVAWRTVKLRQAL